MIDIVKSAPIFQPVVRYALLEQYSNDKVKIRDLWRDREMVISVNKLVINERIMAQFRGNDACTIGYIFASLNLPRAVELAES